MNLDSLIRRKSLPWRPNTQVNNLDVWHEYETPLTGTFQIGSATTVLFTLVLESEHGVSVWAYAELPVDVVQCLADLSFDSVEKLRAWVDDQFRGKEAVLALVGPNGRLSNAWTREVIEPDLLSAVDRFLSHIIKSVDRVSNVVTRVHAKIAGVDAARVELVDA